MTRIILKKLVFGNTRPVEISRWERKCKRPTTVRFFCHEKEKLGFGGRGKKSCRITIPVFVIEAFRKKERT